MGINLQSLSLTSVFNSLVSYFKSQENTTSWKVLSQGSESSFLLRMLSNVFSAISYRIVAQSRENYLSTAALTASCAGIAVNEGYSVPRGNNLKRLIQFTPNSNYTIPKLSTIGTYNEDYDIIVLDDTTLEEGTSVEIKVVVGKVKEESFTTGTSAIRTFSLFTPNISEDYVLYLNNTEVPTTSIMKEMKDDKYLVRTNPYSSVDIAYLNTFPNFQYKYGTGSEITIRYVELADVEVIPFTTGMFSYGTLTSYRNLSSYVPFQSVDEMKVRIPIDHETQNLIRSKSDYAEKFQELVPSIISTDWRAVTPTYTAITYLKNDKTFVTGTYSSEVDTDGRKVESGEIEEVRSVLKEENFFGTPLPDITVPRREVAHLDIKLKLNVSYKNIADINEDIENILENYYNITLAPTFNTYELERELEGLSYVKYARVSHTENIRVPGANYQLGYILYNETNDEYYMAHKILGVSGSSAPAWKVLKDGKDIDNGIEIQDGSIIWRAFKKLPNMSEDELQVWQSNTQYGLGDFVYTDSFPNYMFKCVDLIKSTSVDTNFNAGYAETGDFVVDGRIIWVIKEYNSEYPTRQASTNYRLGQSVNLTSLRSDTSIVSAECISYSGTVGTDEEISFEQQTYEIISNPASVTTNNVFTVSGNKTFYFRSGDVIDALDENSEVLSSFSVVSSILNNDGNTQITVSPDRNTELDYKYLDTVERGTKDGEILWTLVEDPDNIEYGWNSYVTFEHELTILE